MSPKTDAQKAAERAEREDMYYVNPEIFALGMPLPRRTDGTDYTGPDEQAEPR
ncbi:hypothetical protein [Cellulosimicrobium cellulans]|uniref:hypothetical protein n=1 Tax=Cellulosimicrobium cellulans TaxID=1710 RepID=UPI0002EE0FE3|nr:hypothetical protein [Cellulosimicrobium cellulans]